jgi:hypothetical protein
MLLKQVSVHLISGLPHWSRKFKLELMSGLTGLVWVTSVIAKAWGRGSMSYASLLSQAIASIMVLLLVGRSKKTQGQDIKTAQRFWSNYQQELSGD